MQFQRALVWFALTASLSFVKVQSQPSGEQSRTKFTITEEQPTGTFVADLKTLAWYTSDPQLQQASLEFVILSTDGALGRKLFAVDSSSGVVRTATVVDRDSFCRREVTCLVDLDVGVKAPFRLLKIAVEITDINDNSPHFPRPRIDHNLSESTAPGILFPVEVADDPDSPLNGVARYQLLPNSPHFELQQPAAVPASAGDELPVFVDPPLLVLRQPLDRELQHLHQMKIVAYDGGNPPRSGSVLLDIVVTDANDNGPRFVHDQYRAEITENQLPEGPIVNVMASDPDDGENAAVVYAFSRRSISASNNLNITSTFSIDPTSGAITLLRPLDYEVTGPTIKFDVIASNREPGDAPSPTATAQVTVKIMDVNDNAPAIRLDTATVAGNGGGPVVSVPENSPPDTLVAHLSVTDPDTGDAGLVDCSLGGAGTATGQDAARYFRLVRVDEEDFQLLTSSSAVLDRESNGAGVFRLTVKCRDMGTEPGPKTSSLDFRVSVADVDDNAPQFSRVIYNFSLNENAKPGTTIGRVSATDADSDYRDRRMAVADSGGGGIRYHLHEDASDFVAIDPITGIIKSAVQFDHETASVMRFHVLASSSGSSDLDDDAMNSDAETGSRQTASALVIVVILNVDDESPTFIEQNYEFSIAENQPPMTVVGHVTARDADSPPFDVFRYRLDGGTDAEAFTIDPKTGLIRSRQSLDREKQPIYRITAYAESASLPVYRSGSVNVTVRVGDENDNGPIVRYPVQGNGTLPVPSRYGPGHVITRIIASDVDLNDHLSFDLSSLSPVPSADGEPVSLPSSKGSLFRVDRQNGDVKVGAPLDSIPDNTVFRLVITVSDSSSPPRSTTVTLYLIIVHDEAGAEKIWSSPGAGGGPLAKSMDGSDSFRLVLEGNVQLGVVVGIVAFSVVLMCALLATIIVCRRRRRRRMSADGETKDATDMVMVGSQSKPNGPDVERPDEETGSQCQINAPKDWTKLPVDVICNTTTDIQPEPSPSWYGENQWTLGRTQGHGRFFQYDTSPARKDVCPGSERMVRQPPPSTGVFLDQGSPPPSSPAPPSAATTTAAASRPYYSDGNGTLPYGQYGTTAVSKQLPPSYHQHYCTSPASGGSGGGRTGGLLVDGGSTGSMRGRVRFRDSLPSAGMAGGSAQRIPLEQLSGCDPIPSFVDATTTSPPPLSGGGNNPAFQTVAAVTSTASPSILLRSRCLQPDITASTTLPPQQQVLVDGTGRSPMIFNRFKD